MADAKHKVERAAFGAAIDGILKYVNKDEADREKAFLKLVDLSEKFMGDTFRKESYDAGKVGILVKLHAVENSHYTDVFHVTILTRGLSLRS